MLPVSTKLLYFGSETCTMCRMIKPQLKGLDYEIGTEADLLDFGVEVFPTLVLVDKETRAEIKKTTGFHTQSQIIDWVQN